MPMPRAASTVAASTWRTPVNVNVKMGGTASSTSATITGVFPKPSQITPSTITANDGIARPMLATLMVTVPERRLRPSNRPPDTPMTVGDRPSPTPRARDARAHGRHAVSALPVGRVVEPHEELVHGVHDARTRRLHGVSRALRPHQQHVEHDRQHDRENSADEERRVEEAIQPVEDERAEPALVGSENAGDRHETHGRDGRDPQPAHDHRQRDRELDPPELLAPGEPHRGRRLAHRCRDAVDPATMLRNRICSV